MFGVWNFGLGTSIKRREGFQSGYTTRACLAMLQFENLLVGRAGFVAG